MMLLLLYVKKARLLLTLPLGPSTVFCVAVTAWIVVISPSSIPKLSFKTLATGARQLVVQDALLQDNIQRKAQGKMDKFTSKVFEL